MAGPAKHADISITPTTPSGFFHRLLHRIYNVFCEKELHRFAPTRADRMVE